MDSKNKQQASITPAQAQQAVQVLDGAITNHSRLLMAEMQAVTNAFGVLQRFIAERAQTADPETPEPTKKK